MAKLSNAQLAVILSACSGLNYKGKRLASKKLEVCEQVAEMPEVDATAQQISDFMQRKTYADFWAEVDDVANKAKARKTRATDKPSADTMTGSLAQRTETMPIKTGKRFIVTSAQNNTEAAPVLLKLKTLAEKLDAELIVMPIYYNKNAFSPAVKDEREYFTPSVNNFLTKDDTWLGGQMDLRLMPSSHILPTAAYPVNKAAQLNQGELATIVPATKQQMKTLPRLNNAPIKQAWATGCCTVYNYTESGAGSEAERDHVYGGLFIECNEQGYHITNIREGVNGSLQLMNQNGCYVSDDLGTDKPDIVLGDLHCEMQDVLAWETTIKRLYNIQPRQIAVHDILHFETRSHHNRKSGRHLYKVQSQSVRNDLSIVIEQLNQLAEIAPVYIVESNHNSALDNWLDDSSYNAKQDPQNAKLYYLLNYAICEMLDAGYDKPAIEVALLDITDKTGLPALSDNIRFGRMDESEMWYGSDVSQHGHKGQNGSQGNATMMNRWRLPLVKGHDHSPSIYGSVFSVGVMAKLNQGYNRGGSSSWDQSNVVIHSNGACQQLFVNRLHK